MRTAGSLFLIALLFGAGFLGVHWVAAGTAIPVLGAVTLRAAPTAASEPGERRDDAEAARNAADAERDKLRQAVIDTAAAFRLSPCNEALKKAYFEAVAAYVRAFLSTGGCPAYPSCGSEDERLKLAVRAFDTPRDARVRQEIAAINDLGIAHTEYPGNTGAALIGWLDTGFPDPEVRWHCAAAQERAATR